MNFKVAIPSYRRAKQVAEKTVAFLRRNGIPANNINIFLSDPSEEKEYDKCLKHEAYVFPGAKTLIGNRRAIQKFYSEGDNVLCLDDDVKELFERVDEKTKKPISNLIEFVEDAFEECGKRNVGLWGVYPIENPYFMKDRINDKLTYIVGALYGMVNTHDPKMQVTQDDFEDFERTIQFYLRDNSVLRFENYAVSTGYYGEGGMNAEGRTDQRRIDAADRLKKMYPDLCEITTTKKSSHGADLRLKDKRIKEVGNLDAFFS